MISIEWFRLLLRSKNKMAATAQLESLVSRLEQVTSRLEKVSVKGGGQGAAPGKYLVKKQATSQKMALLYYAKSFASQLPRFMGLSVLTR